MALSRRHFLRRASAAALSIGGGELLAAQAAGTQVFFDPASDRPGIIEQAQDRGIPFFPTFGIRVWF